MTQKTRNDITTAINTKLPTNGTDAITAADLRSVLYDLNDSDFNILSDTPITIAQGGTSSTTANGALNALLPSQAGASAKVLTSNGTDASWQTPTTGVSSFNARTGAVLPVSGDYTTTTVPEGSNLYYTTARFNSDFASKSTTNLPEGTNLYYTTARFNTAFATKNSDDLAEGSSHLFVTTTDRTHLGDLSGINSGDQNIFKNFAVAGQTTLTPTTTTETMTVVAGSGVILTTNNITKELTIAASGAGTVTSVTASAPLSSTGGTTPNIAITKADSTHDGYLDSTDWNTFNNKGSGTVESVTGLNTDNTDPTNPIVKISVDGVTIIGDGTPGDPLVSVGGGGSNIYNTSDVITNNDAREVGIYGINTSLTFKAKNSSGDTDPQVFLRFTNDDPMVDLTASNGSGEYIRLYTSGANGYVQDTKGTPVGLEYVADYSATFTNRSLVDKGYVDSMVGAVSSVTASDQTVEVSPTTGAVLITAHLPYIFNYMFMGS